MFRIDSIRIEGFGTVTATSTRAATRGAYRLAVDYGRDAHSHASNRFKSFAGRRATATVGDTSFRAGDNDLFLFIFVNIVDDGNVIIAFNACGFRLRFSQFRQVELEMRLKQFFGALDDRNARRSVGIRILAKQSAQRHPRGVQWISPG
jgi:hypothetical protein